jgi:hypothetical protein
VGGGWRGGHLAGSGAGGVSMAGDASRRVNVIQALRAA